MKNDFQNLQIAHRGIHNNIDIPENSLKAFKLCVKENIPIELDVQLTKDKILVVFHDDNLQRMTNCNMLIKDITYSELQNLTLLKTKEKIPKFSEVLNIVKNKVLLDIEIKNTKNIAEISTILMTELNNYGDNYIIKSFNPKIIRWFKKNYPFVTRGLLLKEDYHNFFYNLLLKNVFILKYCQPHFLAIAKKMLNEEKWQKVNYPTLIWTITSLKEKEKYLKYHVGFICNLPLKK